MIYFPAMLSILSSIDSKTVSFANFNICENFSSQNSIYSRTYSSIYSRLSESSKPPLMWQAALSFSARVGFVTP